jgi:hypothetical protein
VRGEPGLHAHRVRIRLGLGTGVALQLSTKTGVGKNDLDLTGLRLQSLQLETGVGETRLGILAPNPERCRTVSVNTGLGAFKTTGLGELGFERFTFRGGIGGTELDFSGTWERPGEVDIALGIGGASISLPRDLGVELSADKNFLTGFTIKGFESVGGRYRSANLDRTTKRANFRLKAGIGGLDVRWQ